MKTAILSTFTSLLLAVSISSLFSCGKSKELANNNSTEGKNSISISKSKSCGLYIGMLDEVQYSFHELPANVLESIEANGTVKVFYDSVESARGVDLCEPDPEGIQQKVLKNARIK